MNHQSFSVILKVLHLDGWNSICHSRFHLSSVRRSVCSFSATSVFLMLQYVMVSSAKSLMFNIIPSEVSLMKMRNRMGPRTDPCGTPDVLGTFFRPCRPALLVGYGLSGSPGPSSLSCLLCHTHPVCRVVVHFIKPLREIHHYSIDLLALGCVGVELLYKLDELGFAGQSFSESMLVGV